MLNISYGVVLDKSYSLVYPELNELSVPSAVQTITLSINIEGKWNLPDNSNSTDSILTVPNFSSQNNGVYKFFINNWSGIEVCAIQINLTTTTFIHGMSIVSQNNKHIRFTLHKYVMSILSNVDYIKSTLNILTTK